MWKSILKALPLQVTGTISIAVSMLVISRRYGPSIQGEFAYFKSLVEFCAPLLMLGAPQALLYSVRGGRMSSPEGVVLALAYAPLIYGVTLLGLHLSQAVTGPHAIPTPYSMLALCAACFGLSSNIRGVVLAQGQHILFGILSCLSQVVCLLLVACVPLEQVRHISCFYVAGWIVSAGLAVIWAARLLWGQRLIGMLRFPSLMPFLRYGAATYLPVVITAASLALTYTLIERSMDQAAVGNFSIAAMIQQIVVMPVILLAPTLFYAWTSSPADARDGADRKRQFSLVNRYAALYALFCGATQLLLLDFAVTAVLGSEFQLSVVVASIIMIGYLPACLEAATVPLAYATGHPGAAALAATVKGAIIVAGQSLFWPLDLPGVGAVWAAAHWGGWLVLIGVLRARGICRLREAIGLPC